MRGTLRTIFVTELKHRDTGEIIKMYGRYDVIAMNNRGYFPVDQYRLQYEMSDGDFAKYAKLKKKMED